MGNVLKWKHPGMETPWNGNTLEERPQRSHSAVISSLARRDVAPGKYYFGSSSVLRAH
jgi:hypothetical protein